MSTSSPRRDLAQLLAPTWRALLELESRQCVEHDLTHWQYIVLADVLEHPGSAQKEVADRICRSPSRLVGDIDELQSIDLLVRTPVQQDRRTHRLALTTKGRLRTMQVRRLIHKDEDHLLQTLTVSEQTLLRQLLARVLDDRTRRR